MTPAAAVAPLPAFTPEQIERMETLQQIEHHRVLMFSCTVYDHSVTRVSWTFAEEKYDAKHPKEPEPFIMQFWIPEESSGVDSSPRSQTQHAPTPR